MLRMKGASAPPEDPTTAPPPPADPSTPPDPTQADPTADPSGKPSSRFSVEKVDQSISGYMGPEYGPFSCSHCDFFEGPSSCGVVSGNIDPDGCCNLFTPPNDGGQADDSQENPQGDPEAQDVAPVQ